jgi:hypothetical protein
VGLVVEDELELALLDALVEPGAAENQAAQPVDERPVGRAVQAGPGSVDVLAQGGGGVDDLAVHREVDQVLALLVLEGSVDKAEPDGGQLDALGEVTLVEREAQLAVLEHVVGARLVVSPAGRVHFHVAVPFRPFGGDL